jgi:hypothetical protein
MGVFNGWRRKIGLVTLVLACVLMAGWVRSHTYLDGISFSTGKNRVETLTSAGGYVAWQSNDETETVMTPVQLNTAILSKDFSGFNHPAMNWKLRGFGFGIGVISDREDEGLRITMRAAPYWTIVIPLTLLSTGLLLRNPRPAKTATISTVPAI